MRKTYVLDGLSCADCAAKIEKAVRALEGVTSASVNLVTGTLRAEVTPRRAEGITERISAAVRGHEPGIAVTEEGAERREGGAEGGKAEAIRLIVGAAVFCAGLALTRPEGLPWYAAPAVFAASYLILGGDVVWRALRNIARGRVFDENFLMTAATIGAFIIGEYPEAAAVMLFYQTGELFQAKAVRRSKKSIAALMDIRPDSANLLKDGQIIKTAPDNVKSGDFIVVRPGEKVPLDGVVREGESMLDTAALTGESVPRRVSASDTVLSGCVNQNGVLSVEVTKTYGESTASKIIDLVENAASKKAPAEHFITKFARCYTPAVVIMAAMIAAVPPLLAGGLWRDWASRGLLFLVISCPCALVVSIPLSFFGGIGAASKKGVLVKGGNYLEALNNVGVVVFDKTGTLTKGVFEVTGLRPANGFTEGDVLRYAAAAEAFSDHPIALSISKAFGGEVDKASLTGYRETAGLGVSAEVGGVTVLAGSGKLMERAGIAYEEEEGAGTKVYVAAGGVWVGCVTISDEIKPDSRDAIRRLRAAGVRKTVMLTGDDARIASAVAGELGLDEAYGGLLPAQKVQMVEALGERKRRRELLAFVGDGINDAPVLARADVGVAMGGLGSDAAVEAADIVLMTDEPSRLAGAVGIARLTRRVVRQNIVFALGVKAAFLTLGAFGAATMWEAVFADVGVSLLAVLNAARIGGKD
ncbi:MAG: cadmium-translocating P-type ATPase [Oscillospiraceae bacterium]|jgi:Cd2+/Zn2+-exporting ATPase|nr:cadmium-translocating P-type ATPase [Oscillospiraceae bacterium]